MRIFCSFWWFLFLPLGTGQLVMYGNAATTEDTSDNSAEDHDQHSNSVSSSSKTGGTDMILYIVFGVAVAVFILVLIIIVKILRRKNPNPNGYTLTSTGKIHFPKVSNFQGSSYFKKYEAQWNLIHCCLKWPFSFHIEVVAHTSCLGSLNHSKWLLIYESNCVRAKSEIPQ